MSERLYHGYTLEQIEKMGGDNEACIAYDLIAHIRELEADLAAVKRKADACDLWRAEALAASEAIEAVPELLTSSYHEARTARINAGLK